MIVCERVGMTAEQRDVDRYTLSNANGLRVSVLNWGARLEACEVPDRNGSIDNVLVAHRSVDDWLGDTAALGATIGRVANRIRDARFQLNGDDISLPANDGAHHLHGGPGGFDRRLWDGAIEQLADGRTLALSMYLVSEDGDQGYPGRLAVRQRFLLDDDDTLIVETLAQTEADTLFAPTLHPYFNLNGVGRGSVLQHQLRVAASRYLPLDDDGLPNGEPQSVARTPLDFREGMTLALGVEHPMLAPRGGYDHPLLLDKPAGEMKLAAILSSPVSGRRLSVMTTMPSLQVYSANNLSINGTAGPRDAICLEPQFPPDAINQPGLPSPILRRDKRFYARTAYRFDLLAASPRRA